MGRENHTPNHSFRFKPGLYATAKAIASVRGETMTDVLAAALERYVKRYAHMLTPPPEH